MIKIPFSQVLHTQHACSIYLLSAVSSSAYLLPCLCLRSLLECCEVPGLKWVQISRDMEGIKLCDVVSGSRRHPCLLMTSEKHFTQGCGLNAGMSSSHPSSTETPHIVFFLLLLPIGSALEGISPVNNPKMKIAGPHSSPSLGWMF